MRFRLFGICLLLWLASCEGPGKSVPSTGVQDSTQRTNMPAGAVSTPPAPFDRETAETLTAMHFSELNRQAKYLRYKGLLIDMDTIFPASADGSHRFRVRVQGRRWDTPSGDTITRTYQDTINFTATWEGKNWAAKISDQ